MQETPRALSMYESSDRSPSIFGLAIAALLIATPFAAQQIHPATTTDSSAQASPIAQPATTAPANDTATEASPATPQPKGEFIPYKTILHVKIAQSLDSGKIHNGERVNATLDAPIRTSTGRTIPAGTDVSVTVLAVVPAGKLESAGEITLQLIRIAGIDVISDTITRRGTSGSKDLPDSTPTTGKDATIAAGESVVFLVPTIPDPGKIIK